MLPARLTLALLVVALLPGIARAQTPSSESAAEQDADASPTLSLDQLLGRAEESNPGLGRRSAAIRSAEATLLEARLSPFFQFEAQAAVTVAPEARGTPIFSPDSQLPIGNAWRPVVGAGIQGVIPLSVSKLRDVRRAARAGVRASRADRERIRQQLAYDVRRAYFGLSLALDLQQMVREVRGKLHRAVTHMEEQLEEEDADVDELDLFKLRRTVAEVDARASEAVRLEETARAALTALTGVERFSIPDCPLEPVAFTAEPVAHYVARALGERPESAMLQAAMDARRAALSLGRAGFTPDVGIALFARRTYGPGVTDQDNPFVQNSANARNLGGALVARWSLDFAGDTARYRRAQAQLAETRLGREEARRGMSLEVREAYSRMADAQRREQAWGAARRDGRRWFLTASQGYQVGAVETRDLVDAVKGYLTARLEHLRAILDLNTALASLERVTGVTLLERGRWESCDPEPLPAE